MSPDQIKEARRKLGLNLDQMATLLGYDGEHRRQMMHKLEVGERAIREPQRRLIEAYLAGYRPVDWPRAAPRALPPVPWPNEF